jgi:hypothetical protein
MYLNKKEQEAIINAHGYVTNIVEGCTADPETEEGKAILQLLNDTVSGLTSIENKIRALNRKKRSIN